ncbi:ABC transporter ATP-binding protein [Microbacterium terricola]|uniref:ABC transporter ATP-binding protein n=1 Tax=Microbacterium terricola TaxID=344163 RepID=A0ABM8E2S2_9MICO|nr:ATP-binding cassette domain-containing protein [Microbacterium terricola]UYK40039.1 ATP-binding cassette domain-containing protein [Microbacterium terricola]BDV32267.1 ABC transporter ATP-binding protein [Microbacterium terricola]
MTGALTVENLTVVYGGVKPINDLSLVFERDVCGLVGPNGAGKTTFFNVLSGFAVPATGTLTFDGVDLLAMNPAKRARWGLRRTFQQEQVIHTLTAWDNIRLSAEHTGGGREAVHEAVDFVGLTGLDRPGSELTMLERRLVELAKTVCGGPKLVLLDEPGAGLDVSETERLTGLIRRIPSEFGALVILVDHDMDLVSTVCGATAVLDFGQLIAYGPTAEVLASAEVRRAYLGTSDLEATV